MAGHRYKGTPQGSSVSLLLANIANHDLDVQLAACAGRFVRFADDVVALTSEYSHAEKIERCFLAHCRASGLSLNLQKTLGIGVIHPKAHEIRTYPNLDYLGYRFNENGLSLPDKTVIKIKARISRLVNLYLLHYLKDGFSSARVSTGTPHHDWDLLGLIHELRGSLYGGLSEGHLRRFIHEGKALPAMRGLMGFYCLLDDPKPLKELDGWMLNIIRRATRERNRRLTAAYGLTCPTPSSRDLATGAWFDRSAWREGEQPETQVPSFMRGWRAAKKHFYSFGLEKVQAPNYTHYNDFADLFEY